MEMPEGWKKLKYQCSETNPICRSGLQYGSGLTVNEAEPALDLMKEMAEALEKVQAIAEMTMPNGTVTPTPLYDDVTPILKKFKEWK